jgi:hypothetical protein
MNKKIDGQGERERERVWKHAFVPALVLHYLLLSTVAYRESRWGEEWGKSRGVVLRGILDPS